MNARLKGVVFFYSPQENKIVTTRITDSIINFLPERATFCESGLSPCRMTQYGGTAWAYNNKFRMWKNSGTKQKKDQKIVR